MYRKKLQTLIRRKVYETAEKEAKTKCEGKKKTRKLARENKIERKYITKQRNENEKTIFEIRVDMTKIEYNSAKAHVECQPEVRTLALQSCILAGRTFGQLQSMMPAGYSANGSQRVKIFIQYRSPNRLIAKISSKFNFIGNKSFIVIAINSYM